MIVICCSGVVELPHIFECGLTHCLVLSSTFRGLNGGGPGGSSSNSSSHLSNGYGHSGVGDVGQNSPNSSQLSSDGGGGGGGGGGSGSMDATLISRTQKQHTTQQVRLGWEKKYHSKI